MIEKITITLDVDSLHQLPNSIRFEGLPPNTEVEVRTQMPNSKPLTLDPADLVGSEKMQIGPTVMYDSFERSKFPVWVPEKEPPFEILPNILETKDSLKPDTGSLSVFFTCICSEPFENVIEGRNVCKKCGCWFVYAKGL